LKDGAIITIMKYEHFYFTTIINSCEENYQIYRQFKKQNKKKQVSKKYAPSLSKKGWEKKNI
jgi:hypothetical protein